ncbi:MBL fold metallo-hydrolase [candidate division KSB1 bacterium]|nr:MBL fold metallo-hydrolase [candidate division KSB1 bacterium]
MRIRLWGTRGSIPVPGPDTFRYGGNTTCVEVRLDDGTIIIFDAGTGIRPLGLALMTEQQPLDLKLIFTHTHWDHLQGFPFFEPINNASTRITISSASNTSAELKQTLISQMDFKNFPINFKSLKAQILFEEIDQPEHHIGNARLYSIPTNHPGSTCGYKLVEGSRSFVFLTDNELRPQEPAKSNWQDFVAFCQGSDLMLHDAMWMDDEITNKRGWGHSSMEQVMELAALAQPKKVILFHHLPRRSDQELEERFNETLTRKATNLSNTSFVLAREGDIFIL